MDLPTPTTMTNVTGWSWIVRNSIPSDPRTLGSSPTSQRMFVRCSGKILHTLTYRNLTELGTNRLTGPIQRSADESIHRRLNWRGPVGESMVDRIRRQTALVFREQLRASLYLYSQHLLTTLSGALGIPTEKFWWSNWPAKAREYHLCFVNYPVAITALGPQFVMRTRSKKTANGQSDETKNHKAKGKGQTKKLYGETR